VKTDEHDFNTKISHAKKFLEKGYKIRVTVKMMGRENIYSDKAIAQIEKVATALALKIEQGPTRLGTRFSATLIKSEEPVAAKADAVAGKPAQDKNSAGPAKQ
jgi:translation initiation factor IF-3